MAAPPYGVCIDRLASLPTHSPTQEFGTRLFCWISIMAAGVVSRIACIALVTVTPLLFTLEAHAEPPSVETFFAKSPYGGAVLSPNGQFLAVTVVYKGRYNASVIDLENRKATAITNLEKGDVTRVVWQNDNRMIVYIGDLHRGTGEPPSDFGVVAVNRDGTDVRNYGGLSVLQVIPDTNDILYSAYERSRRSTDIYRLNTLAQKSTLLTFERSFDAGRWTVDFDGSPRAVVAYDLDNDKSAWYVRARGTDPWRKVEETAYGKLQSVPLRFSPDGKTLYVESRRDSDRAAIYEYDIASDKWSDPIVKHAERDIDAAFVANIKERKLLGLRYTDDKPSVIWFDPEFAKMQKSVDAALPDTVNVIQKSGDHWLVVAFSDRNPGDVYLLDGRSMKMESLFSYAPAIPTGDMAPMKWVRYQARDGLSIPALLTIPRSAEGKRAPLVVVIHGGPNVPANRWGYNAEVQFLASRGYAVLQPQYRGTEGFGSQFETAGYRKWGDEMQDDLEDGVKWAVAQGIADPDKVCFYGASYGGYAAIWGAIKNAKLIKCAVSYVGVTSIDYIFDNAQTSMSRAADKSSAMAEAIGDPKTERARFKRVSPLDNADKVGVPLLLAYGAADRVVPLVHGTDFRAALDKYGKSYEWVVYDAEGHGFSRDDHLFDFYHRVDKFLAKYLGPGALATKAN